MTVRLTSIATLGAQRALDRANDTFTRSLERLASGQRINRAADDAAGLAIASTLRNDTRVFGQAVRNINDALSYLNIADGSLSILADVTTRLQELAAQAANGSYSAVQRRALDEEGYRLTLEFNRVVRSTAFNGRMVIQGSNDTLTFQAGYSTLSFGMVDALERNVGTGSFSSRASFDINGTGRVAADFDGDGVLDIAEFPSATSIATWYRGNGDGTFGAAQQIGPLNGANAIVGAGDFDGDGKADLVVTNGTSAAIGYSSGGSTLNVARFFTLGTSVNISDVDGDGVSELLQIRSGNLETLKLQAGVMGITASQAVSFNSFVLGDLDGNGSRDLVGRDGSGTISFFLNSGSGSFALRNSVQGTGLTSLFAVTDLNGDGLGDLVGYNGSQAQTFLQGLDGSVSLFQSLASTSLSTVLAGDVNGDGVLDLFSNNRLFYGSRDGTFSAGITTGANASSTFADFNGDGVLDLLGRSSPIGVWLQGSSKTTEIQDLRLSSRTGALSAIGTISATLNRILAERGVIGSSMSRLQTTLATLAASRENFSSAESRIVDADVAFESAQLVRSSILKQTAAAILGQAQQQPALALKLLSG